MEKERQSIFRFSLSVTLLLSAFVAVMYFYLPQYQAVYERIPGGASTWGLAVFLSYRYWIAIPLVSLWMTWQARNADAVQAHRYSLLMGALLICCFALLLLFYFGVMRPLESMAVNGEIWVPVINLGP